MFGDTFDTPEELLTGKKEGHLQSNWDNQPRNCADLLPMPEKQRKKGYPVGLKNQGATCYLNSLLQILYHTPELRRTILHLPLCHKSIDEPTDFVIPSKQKFLLAFQRLFSEMTLLDGFSVGSEYLNAAFGWEGTEHLEQQDIQEAMRIIFDTFQRAMVGTPAEETVKGLYRGVSCRYKTCRKCGIITQHLEDYYDLPLQVKHVNNLDDSLMRMLTAEEMAQDNQIFCEGCESKQDFWLGTKLKSLPKILIFTLNRFEFDYEKMDRVKINDMLQFNLQYNFSHLVEDAQADLQYELYGVLIHRGSAHAGHYIAYVRDILQESDWEEGIKKTKSEEAKQKENNEKQENGEKKKEEESIPSLTQPSNPALKLNWYCLNDETATPIEVSKIAAQFLGSESAYILFYRKVQEKAEPESPIIIPTYFSGPILAHNAQLQTLRDTYQFQRRHIVLTINDTLHKLQITMKISALLQLCGIDEHQTLVQQSVHNGLPYYPQKICSSNNEQSIEGLLLPHESIWRSYLRTDPHYISNIEKSIGKDRLPFEVEVIYATGTAEGKKKLVVFADETLLMFRLNIEQFIPYEKQILKLVTPYRQMLLATSDDDVLITKLGFVHGCQITAKSLEKSEEETEDVPDAHSSNLYCFIVERDDTVGIKRIYFQKEKTLTDLLHELMASMGLDGNRRLRRSNLNRLFYTEHMDKKLSELELDEQMIKIKIERGQIPVKGDIGVTVIIQSKHHSQESKVTKVYDPNTIIAEMKAQVCREFNLEPTLHKLYMTDWMGQPVRSVTREKLTIFEANFGREQLLCLRDIDSPIGSELVHLEVFTTKKGTPEDISGSSVSLKIQEFKSVLELKQAILDNENIIQKGLQLTPKQLRIRQVKRDYMFGSIWRDPQKQVKHLTTNSNKIVIQILQLEEQLTEDQIVLLLKKRNVEKRTYEECVEIIFDAGKTPSVDSLKQAIKNHQGIQEDVRIVKYFNYNFEWNEISVQCIEEFGKGKVTNKKAGVNKKKKDPKGQQKVAQKQTIQEKQQIQEKQKIEDKIAGNEAEANEESTLSEKPQQQKPKNKERKEKGKGKQGQEGQEGKPPKKGKEAKPKQQDSSAAIAKKIAQGLNLRKAPVLLKDGDWIGYGIGSLLGTDDMQTEEDLMLRALQGENNGGKHRPKGKDQGGFKLKLDF